MKLRLPPLALMSLLALCGFNAWLLNVVIAEFAPADPPPSPAISHGGKAAPTTVATFSPKPVGAYGTTLAQPVFFRTRKPYVPPPPAPPPVVQAPPPPPVVVVNPGLTVTGVIIKDRLKKAYLLNPGDPRGTWVAEGDNVLGWTVQSVKPTGVTLEQSNRTIDLDLYMKR